MLKLCKLPETINTAYGVFGASGWQGIWMGNWVEERGKTNIWPPYIIFFQRINWR